MDKLPRVFLPVRSNAYNTDRAEDYGIRVFVLQTNDFSPFNTDALRSLTLRTLCELDFDPAVDYIALTGPPPFVAMFWGLALARYRKLRTLIFDARSGAYVERIIQAEDDRGKEAT